MDEEQCGVELAPRVDGASAPVQPLAFAAERVARCATLSTEGLREVQGHEFDGLFA
jgi:hypothetical protein